MNWTYTLQQLEDIQTANRIQRENGSEDIGYAWDNTEDDGDGEKLKNLTYISNCPTCHHICIITCF